MSTGDQFDWESLGRGRPPTNTDTPLTGAPEGGSAELSVQRDSLSFSQDGRTVYRDADRASPVIAEVKPGDVRQVGATTDHNGWSWLAVTLVDGQSGHICIGRAEPASHRAIYLAMIIIPLVAFVGGVALLFWKDFNKPIPSRAGPPAPPETFKCTVTQARGGKFGLNIQLIIQNDDRDLYNVNVTSLRLRKRLSHEWVDAFELLPPIRKAWKKGTTMILTTSQFDEMRAFDLELEANEEAAGSLALRASGNL